MDEADWPSFPASLLEAPAEEWGRLPGGGRGWKQGFREAAQQQSDEEASAANLLADLEEAFAGARGDVDRAKALETMQTFLSVRRVRLLEDLMLLDVSLGGGNGTEEEQKRWETTGGRGIGNANSSSSSNRDSATAFPGGDAVGGTALPSSHAASTAAAAAARTRHLSGTMDLNRELALARQKLHELNRAPNASGVENQNVDDTVTLAAAAAAAAAAATDAAGKSAGAPSLSMAGNSVYSACDAGALDEAKVKGVGVLLREGGVEEEGLRTAAEESTEAFFVAWAERFGHLIVSLGLGGEQGGDGEGGGVAGGGGGGGGGGRKDDREIQAARDVERDILCVNGVLVVGSEGYSAVVGRVKRELGRVADPVAGPDGAPLVVQGGAGAGAAAAGEGGGGDGPSLSSKSMPVPDTSAKSLEICPLRPPRQLQNFSKLVLKAANRTESGGLSFDAIHRVMELCPGACDGSVLVVPDSSKAEPLGITVSAEAYTEKGSAPSALPESVGSAMLKDGLHTFGICARIEAVTVYSLYSADMEHVHLRLRATFRSSMRLALSPVSNVTCEAFADVGYRGEQGSVEIEVVEGSHASGH